jgi:WD40 repeat protein
VAKIFVSHSSRDHDWAVRVRDWLDHNGWGDLFIDFDPERGIKPGDRWQEALKASTFSCQLVLFLVSEAWASAPYCIAEYYVARTQGKRCFPVLIEATARAKMPTTMAAEHQAVDLTADDGFERLRIGLRAAGLDPETFEYNSVRSPYPGLPALTEDDAAIFFGRDAHILAALDTLRRMRATGVHRVLVILGASGSGKSSLMRAGLSPRLRRDSQNFIPCPVVRPAGAPMSGDTGLCVALETAVASAAAVAKLAADVPRTKGAIELLLQREGGAGLVRLLASVVGAHAGANATASAHPVVVLAIDQAEELWGTDAGKEAPQFLEIVGHAIEHCPALLAILTIRSQSYPRLQEDGRVPAERQELFTLDRVPEGSFRSIIERPARLANITLEPALVEQLLADVAGQDALPLLAFVLGRLYRDYGADADLTKAEYEQLGGISGAIEIAVAHAFAQARARKVAATDRELEALTKRIFLPHLARVDDQSEFIRRIARASEIPSDAAPLLPFLADAGARLLVVDRRVSRGDDEGGGAVVVDVVEVSHEVILRRWPLLNRWLIEEKEQMVWRQRVEQAWRDHRAARESEKTSSLLSGLPLEAARRHETDWVLALAPAQGAFVQRSIAEDDARKAAAAKRRAVTRIGTAAASLVLAALGVLSLILGRRAETAADAARQAAIVRAAGAAVESDPAVAALLLRELDPGHPPDGVVSVASAVARGPFATAAFDTAGFSAPVFSDSGRYVAFLHGSQTLLRVWPSDGRRSPVEFRCDGRRIRGIALAPDDSRVALATVDGPVCLAAIDGSATTVLKGHSGAVQDVRFSPDRRLLASGSDDGTVRLWPVEHVESVQVLREHGARVRRVAFSRDNSWLATASDDGTTKIWRVGANASSMTLGDGRTPVTTVDFNADASRVVTTDAQGAVRVSDVATGREDRIFMPTRPGLQGARFANGRNAVLITYKDAIGVADVATGQEVALVPPEAPIGGEIRYDSRSIVVSDDGGRVAATNGTRTVRVWERGIAGARTWTIAGFDFYVSEAILDASGRTLLTRTAPGSVRIWKIDGIGEPRVIADDSWVADISPAGERVLLRRDQELRLLVGDTLTDQRHLSYASPIKSAETDRRGNVIAALLDDGTVSLADVRAAHDLGRARDTAPIEYTRLSPNGTHLLTRVKGAPPSVRPVNRLDRARTLERALDADAQFSPDGERLVGIAAKELLVWSATTGQATQLKLETGQPLAARFTADSSRVIAVASDGSAHLLRPDGTNVSTVALAKGPIARSNPDIGDDGDWVIAWEPEGGRLWWVSGGTATQSLPGPCDVQRYSKVVFSPSGRFVLRACSDVSAFLWHLPATAPSRLNGEGGVIDASFSRDDALAVTVSHDGPITVWRTDPATQLAQLSPATEATITADGKRVIAKTSAGLLEWRIDPGDLLRAIAKDTTMCFTVEQRARYLGEDGATAQRAVARCEATRAARRVQEPR